MVVYGCSGLEGTSTLEKMAISTLLGSFMEMTLPECFLKTKAPPVADATTPKADAIAAKKRLQYKIYQRRHRAKQREKERSLEQHVAQLTQEISQLKQWKNQASVIFQPPPAPAWCGITQFESLVREYMRLFEYGYLQGSGLQSEFVHTMMAQDVRGPKLQGVDDLMKQWQLYSQIFEAIHLKQRQLDVERLGDVTIVQAAVTLKLAFDHTSVSTLFPQLLEDDVFASTLLQTPLTIQGTLRFDFDSGRRCVSWLASEMDFVGAFLQAFGSLSKLAHVIQGSRLDLTSGYILEMNGHS